MKEKELDTVAGLICKVIREKESAVPEVLKKVKELTDAFPLY